MNFQEETPKAFFQRRSGSGGCLSLRFKRDEPPREPESKRERRKDKEQVRLTERPITVDELDIQRPQPFCRQKGKDSYDFKDVLAPPDLSVDQWSAEFEHLTTSVKTNSKYKSFSGLAAGMVCLTSDGGVKKRILQLGKSTTANEEEAHRVTDGCRVWIHYELYAEDKRGRAPRVLDSTKDHRLAASIAVGVDGLPGMYYALKSMKLLEIAEFMIEPKYAYGKFGIPMFIEPDTRVCYIIQLNSISKNYKKPVECMSTIDEEFASLSLSDVLGAVDKFADAAKEKIAIEYYRDAAERYQRAISLLDDYEFNTSADTLDLKTTHRIKFKLYSNLALCYIRRNEYRNAFETCKSAQQLYYTDPEIQPKLYYRYAVACMHLDKFEKAEQLCGRGLRSLWGHKEFRDLKYKIQNAKLGKEIRDREKKQEEEPAQPELQEERNRPRFCEVKSEFTMDDMEAELMLDEKVEEPMDFAEEKKAGRAVVEQIVTASKKGESCSSSSSASYSRQ